MRRQGTERERKTRVKATKHATQAETKHLTSRQKVSGPFSGGGPRGGGRAHLPPHPTPVGTHFSSKIAKQIAIACDFPSQGFPRGKDSLGAKEIAAMFSPASANRNRNRRNYATLGEPGSGPRWHWRHSTALWPRF